MEVLDLILDESRSSKPVSVSLSREEYLEDVEDSSSNPLEYLRDVLSPSSMDDLEYVDDEKSLEIRDDP
jgi:hypothetical protein